VMPVSGGFGLLAAAAPSPAAVADAALIPARRISGPAAAFPSEVVSVDCSEPLSVRWVGSPGDSDTESGAELQAFVA
jgi:hypothetical protein